MLKEDHRENLNTFPELSLFCVFMRKIWHKGAADVMLYLYIKGMFARRMWTQNSKSDHNLCPIDVNGESTCQCRRRIISWRGFKIPIAEYKEVTYLIPLCIYGNHFNWANPRLDCLSVAESKTRIDVVLICVKNRQLLHDTFSADFRHRFRISAFPHQCVNIQSSWHTVSAKCVHRLPFLAGRPIGLSLTGIR